MNETSEHSIAEKDKNLYGLLLSVNEQLVKSAGGLIVVSVVLSVLVCVGLHLGLFDRFLGEELLILKKWYVYLILVIVAFVIGGVLDDKKSKRIYSRYRSQIFHTAEMARISVYELIVELEGDSSLKEIRKMLKRDKNLKGDV